jgi:hypothetical protein
MTSAASPVYPDARPLEHRMARPLALGPDDPAFALVELNRLAIKEAIEKTAGEIMERLNALPEGIRSSSTALAAEVASYGTQRIVEMLAESRRTIAADTEQAQRRIADHTAKLNEPFVRKVAAVMPFDATPDQPRSPRALRRVGRSDLC